MSYLNKISIFMLFIIMLQIINVEAYEVVSNESSNYGLEGDENISKEARNKMPEKVVFVSVGLDYQGEDQKRLYPNITELPGTPNDAVCLSSQLSKTLNATTYIFGNTATIPTKDSILSTIKQRKHKNTLLIIHLGLHGQNTKIDEHEDQYFLVWPTVDGQTWAKGNTISLDEIREAIGKSGVEEAWVFVDACREKPITDINADQLMGIARSRNGLEGNPKIFFFFASSANQRSYEKLYKAHNHSHGYFSAALFEAISGKAADQDGNIYLGRVISYVKQQVSKNVKEDLQKDQFPQAVVDSKIDPDYYLIATNSLNLKEEVEPSTLGVPNKESGAFKQEEEDWNKIKDLVTKEPQNKFVSRKSKSNNLIDKENNVLELIRGFVEKYPNSTHIPECFPVDNFNVTLMTRLSTKDQYMPKGFRCRVETPLRFKGMIIEGTIVGVKKPGHVSDSAEIAFVFDNVIIPGSNIKKSFDGLIQGVSFSDNRSSQLFTKQEGDVTKITSPGKSIPKKIMTLFIPKGQHIELPEGITWFYMMNGGLSD